MQEKGLISVGRSGKVEFYFNQREVFHRSGSSIAELRVCILVREWCLHDRYLCCVSQEGQLVACHSEKST